MSNFYKIPAEVNLGGIGTLAFVLSGYNHYTPHQFTGGFAYDLTPEMTLTADLSYELWSAAPSPYIDLNIDLSGETLDALGLGEALDITAPRTSPGLANTLNVRAGFEYRVSEDFAGRAGLFYRPTMVPLQDAPGTNIMDGTRVGGSLGLGARFHDPLELLEGPLAFDVGVTGSTLLGRQANKEPTDNVPSYTYSALVLGAQASLSYAFGDLQKKPNALDENLEEQGSTEYARPPPPVETRKKSVLETGDESSSSSSDSDQPQSQSQVKKKKPAVEETEESPDSEDDKPKAKKKKKAKSSFDIYDVEEK
jgi:hypothetical protein